MTDLFPIFHHKCTHSNGIAFYYDEPPVPGMVLEGHKARLVEGRRPVFGEPIHCGSCGVRLHMFDLAFRR